MQTGRLDVSCLAQSVRTTLCRMFVLEGYFIQISSLLFAIFPVTLMFDTLSYVLQKCYKPLTVFVNQYSYLVYSKPLLIRSCNKKY